MSSPTPLTLKSLGSFAVLQVAAWGAYGVSEFVQIRDDEHTLLSGLVLAGLPAVIALGVTSLMALPLLQARRLAGWRFIAVATVLCLVAGLLFTVIHMEAKYWLGYYDRSRLCHLSKVLFHGWSRSFLMGLWAAVFIAIVTARQLAARELALARLERDAAQARLGMLRYQINPHFLFNALNSISGLILGERYDAAETATQRLAAFLRHTLEQPERLTHGLSEELHGVELYLAVERVRFGDRVRTEMQIDPGLSDFQLPVLLLQPLVENAMKHGISQCEEGGVIGLSATPKQDGADAYADIRITNTVCTPTTAPISLGVGLRNVANRLTAAYGEAAELTVSTPTPESFEVRLRLPLLPRKTPSS